MLKSDARTDHLQYIRDCVTVRKLQILTPHVADETLYYLQSQCFNVCDPNLSVVVTATVSPHPVVFIHSNPVLHPTVNLSEPRSAFDNDVLYLFLEKQKSAQSYIPRWYFPPY